MTRFLSLGLGLLTCLAPASAQSPRLPGDPLADARARQTISDQRAQADVQEALRDAERLAKTSPVKAALRLKAAQDAIDLSAAISPTARQTLVAQLQAKLGAVDARSAPAGGLKLDPKAQAARDAQVAALLAARKEAAAVQEGITAIAKDQAFNRMAEATTKIASLQRSYPNNPAVLALTQKDGVGGRVADAKELAIQQDRRIVLAMNDVARSSLPPLGDIEFPKDWADKTKRRLKEVELSTKEKAIIKALDAPMSLAVRDRPFEEVVQDLSNRMNQELFLDTKSLQDAGLDLKKPVSLAGKDISARTFLRQLLAGQGLTFVIQDEVIKVVTVEKAQSMLITRAYYLGDLVQGVGPFAGTIQWGPFVDYEQTMSNVKVLMDAITGSIDPLSWKEKGGPGSVVFHFPSMSLIVRASAEVQASLSSHLKGR